MQPGTAQTTLLDAIFAANNIDKAKVEIVNIDPAAFVGTLLEKKVDAILGGADFQSVQIRDRGLAINDILYRDVGVPTVGLSIIARDDRMKARCRPVPPLRRRQPAGLGRRAQEPGGRCRGRGQAVPDGHPGRRS